MALVPQVVDAVSPIPVVASGGIFDGRGIAAALMLGAVGVNLGTRFIASKEAPGSEEWKQAILHANSEDSIKVEVLNDISPVPGAVGFGTALRSLRTPILDEMGWQARGGTPRPRPAKGRDPGDASGRSAARDTSHCRTDCGRHQGNPAGGRDYAPPGNRTRSGAVAGRGLFLKRRT